MLRSERAEWKELTRSQSCMLWFKTINASWPAFGIHCSRVLIPISSERLSYWIKLIQYKVGEKAICEFALVSRVIKLPCGSTISFQSLRIVAVK